MSRAETELAYQRYLSLREQAGKDWRRLAQITALVAEQFLADSPHGGDIQALQVRAAGARWIAGPVLRRSRPDPATGPVRCATADPRLRRGGLRAFD